MARDRQRAKQRRASASPGPEAPRPAREHDPRDIGLDRPMRTTRPRRHRPPSRPSTRCPTSKRRAWPRPVPIAATTSRRAPAPTRSRTTVDARARRSSATGRRRSRAARADAAPRRRAAACSPSSGTVIDELRRVQWPDRRQVGQGTAVVARVRRPRRRLPRPARRHLEAPRSRQSSTESPRMFRWYVINTYSGHENKVKQNLEHRVVLAQPAARRAPGRRPDRDRPGDEGQPEGLGREADHARLRARQHGPQRGFVVGREGHARA